MTNSKLTELDILRNRREEAGIAPYREISVSSIRKRGRFFGGIILGLNLCSCLGIVFFNYSVESKKNKLEIQAKEYDILKQDFNKEITLLKSIYLSNQEIADGIIGVRSGSAILSELTEIMPRSIQLKNIETAQNLFKVEGVTEQTTGLDSINYMKLQIANSKFTNPKSIKIERAWAATQNSMNNSSSSKLMNFRISGEFRIPKKDTKLAKYLYNLGSIGLSKRLEILNKEGLLK